VGPSFPEEGASQRLRRDLRAINADGVAFSVMVGVGETYLVPFALALGIAVEQASLLATLPILAGSLLQLGAARGVRRLGSYRRWVVACASLQALCFVPLLAGALTGGVPLWALFAVGTVYWGSGMATGPAWNAWVGVIVPARVRARYFARRTLWAQLALLLSIVAAGYGLELGKREDAAWLAFAVLFGVAGVARIVSSRFLATQSEPPGLAARLEAIRPIAVLRTLRGSGAARLLGWLLAMQVAVNVAAPFFVPYMLGPLALSYDGFMLLTAASFLSRVAVLPLLGRLARGGGSDLVLRLGAIGIVPLPALWLVSNDFTYLLVLQTCAGLAWAAVELATLLAFFDGLAQETRTSVLALYNLGSAAAIALGSLIGAALFASLGGGAPAYAALFVVSSVLRAAALPLLRRMARAPAPRESLELSTLAVRPSVGALQRPIASSLDAAEEAPECVGSAGP
jgi:MFS family permease